MVASPHLKLVVMGTGPFAVPMFEALRHSPHPILAVVTRPAHAAPGRRPPKNPMRDAAEAAGIPVLAPERVNDDESVAAIEKLGADLFVVCDYGQILSPRLLAAAPLGGINLHGSLLPRHRGAAPVQWAILEGDPITGVSVIHMTPALDAGAVIVARAAPIYPGDTALELERHLATLGADATLEAIERLQAAAALQKLGEPLAVGIPQDAAHATKAPRLTKADGVVQWSQPAHRLERMRRALEPWPRTASFLHRDGATPLRLVLEDVAVVEHRAAAAAAPGTILGADDDGIVVACGAGTALAIRQLLPEGRRSMTAAEFLRGHPILPGMRFAPR
ncbi:MAG: methionyl-tRNA formyltransferase [Planctomycetia bacterium]